MLGKKVRRLGCTKTGKGVSQTVLVIFHESTLTIMYVGTMYVGTMV